MITLASRGAAVTLVARTAATINAAVDDIRTAGGTARAMPQDVSDVEAATVAIAKVGPFDILVNSAGTNRPKPFVEVTEDDFDHIFDAMYGRCFSSVRQW